MGVVILYTLTNTSQRYYIFLKYASFSPKKTKKSLFVQCGWQKGSLVVSRWSFERKKT